MVDGVEAGSKVSLSDTAAGTAMGNYLRAHWIPFYLSEDVDVPGAPPRRVRLLSEDLVVFRDSNGVVGLLGERCPHRSASLALGRNEDGGLACVYHGWKFDVAGKCMAAPNEPIKENEERLKARVRQKSYPCIEKNGLIWTYMGDAERPPALPDFEWNNVPPEQVYYSLRVQECHWLQALEGDIDSSHAPILHGFADDSGKGYLGMSDRPPVFEVKETETGLLIGARRSADELRDYWRVTVFQVPFYAQIPPVRVENISGQAVVPIDDTHCLVITYSYHPTRALSDKELKFFREGTKGRDGGHMSASSRLPDNPALPYGKYWSKYNRSNLYGIDWEDQRTRFSGLPGLWVQDAGVAETAGPIADRSLENLCSSDLAIVRARRRLLRDASSFATGVVPKEIGAPESYRARAVGIGVGREDGSLETLERYVYAKGGLGYEIF